MVSPRLGLSGWAVFLCWRVSRGLANSWAVAPHGVSEIGASVESFFQNKHPAPRRAPLPVGSTRVWENTSHQTPA